MHGELEKKHARRAAKVRTLSVMGIAKAKKVKAPINLRFSCKFNSNYLVRFLPFIGNMVYFLFLLRMFVGTPEMGVLLFVVSTLELAVNIHIIRRAASTGKCS